MQDFMRDEPGAPKVVDRSTFQAELDALRVREKAHTREGDAIAAARRRLPMVEVDGTTPLIGERGAVTLLDAFEGRRMLIAYYFMWHAGHPAPEQCEGCTLVYIAGPRAVLSFILATSPTPRSARARTKRAPGTATSWAGRCPGTRRQGLARHSLGWTPGGHDAHRLLPATRIQCLRDLLDDEARRRGDGQQLRVARPDRLRAAGDVGGLAGRLATTAERQAQLPYRWTSHRPVASPEGRVFRRSGGRQALNRATISWTFRQTPRRGLQPVNSTGKGTSNETFHLSTVRACSRNSRAQGLPEHRMPVWTRRSEQRRPTHARIRREEPESKDTHA